MKENVAVTTITDEHVGANQLFLRGRGGYIRRTYDTRLATDIPADALDLTQLEAAEIGRAAREGCEPDLRVEHLGETLASGTVLFKVNTSAS